MPGLFDSASPSLLGLFAAQQAPNAYMAKNTQQIQQAIYNAAAPQLGHADAVQMALNPEAQKQWAAAHFGNPKAEGDVDIGGIKMPVMVHDRGIMPALGGAMSAEAGHGGAGLKPLMDLSNRITAQKAEATKTGETAAAAKAALPNVEAQVNEAHRLITDLLADPNLESVTGNVVGRLPAGMTMTAEGANTVAKIEQVKGLANMQALQGLRGIGRITNAEFIKGGDSIARLNRAQSTEGFKKALTDLQSVMAGVKSRAQTAAGVTPAPNVVDYTHYFGGK